MDDGSQDRLVGALLACAPPSPPILLPCITTSGVCFWTGEAPSASYGASWADLGSRLCKEPSAKSLWRAPLARIQRALEALLSLPNSALASIRFRTCEMRIEPGTLRLEFCQHPCTLSQLRALQGQTQLHSPATADGVFHIFIGNILPFLFFCQASRAASCGEQGWQPSVPRSEYMYLSGHLDNSVVLCFLILSKRCKQPFISNDLRSKMRSGVHQLIQQRSNA